MVFIQQDQGQRVILDTMFNMTVKARSYRTSTTGTVSTLHIPTLNTRSITHFNHVKSSIYSLYQSAYHTLGSEEDSPSSNPEPKTLRHDGDYLYIVFEIS